MKIKSKLFDFHGFRVFWILLFILPLQVFAYSDFVEQRAFYIDQSNQLTIDSISQYKFNNYSSVDLKKGYVDHPLWIKLTLKDLKNQQLMLRMLPTYLDSLLVYQRINHQWRVTRVGDSYPYASFEYPFTSFVVGIDKNIDLPEIFIKVTTTSNTQVSTEVMTENELFHQENKRDLILSGYMGVILMTLIYSISLIFRFKDKLIYLITLLTAVKLIFVFFLVGFAGHYLFPNLGATKDTITSLLIFALTLSGFIFHRYFVKEEVGDVLIVRAISVLISFDVMLLVIFILGYEIVALIGNNLLAICVAVILCKIPIDFLLNKKSGYSLSIATVYALLGSGVLLTAAPIFGLEIGHFWTVVSDIFTGFFTTLLLLKLVYDRNRQTQIKDQAIAFQREKEKWAHNQQKQLLSMLVHEIKSPLSVLKLAVDRQLKGSDIGNYANRAIDNIDELINRFVEFDRLDEISITVRKDRFDIGELIQDIINKTSKRERFSEIKNQHYEVFSDVAIVKVILQNLVENALKYSPDNSTISLLLHFVNDKMYFSISNKVGIAGAPDPSLVFSKYYRNPKASRVTGTGLGLYLVYSLVKLLNGSITYKNSHEDLVEFELWIPC
ncbi:MAG: hypothetical protein KGI88_01795 [Betaproteobacteria bacterium]|nr:hypothetical protein [Betaproteobacteria bacterium]MDE2055950.1 hypothetical protein [Betaproteobacteria bacterium]